MLALSRACLISCLAVVEEVTRKALYNVPAEGVCVLGGGGGAQGELLNANRSIM